MNENQAMRFSDLSYVVVMLVTLAAVGYGLFAARRWAFATYGDQQAGAQWEDWRTDVAEQSKQPVGVKRRVPKSVEPPALVLMRDYFAICLTGSLGLTAVLAGTLIFFIRGAGAAAPFVDRSPPEPHDD